MPTSAQESVSLQTVYSRLGGPITLHLQFLDSEGAASAAGAAIQALPQQQWLHAELALHTLMRLLPGISPAVVAAAAMELEAAVLGKPIQLHDRASPAAVDTPRQVWLA